MKTDFIFNVTFAHNFNDAESFETAHSPNCMNPGSFMQPITVVQPPESAEVCSGNSTFSGVDPSIAANKVLPISERKEDILQSQPNMAYNELEFASLNSQSSNISDLQDPSITVLNNQGLWNLPQDTNFHLKPDNIEKRIEASGVGHTFVNADYTKEPRMQDEATMRLNKLSNESSSEHALLAKGHLSCQSNCFLSHPSEK